MNISERIKYSQLFGIYKMLLTDNQQRIFYLYNEQDVGYSEIGVEFSITRQGVRDIILKTQSKLLEYESKLHVLESFCKITKELKELAGACADANVDETICKRIEELAKTLEE